MVLTFVIRMSYTVTACATVRHETRRSPAVAVIAERCVRPSDLLSGATVAYLQSTLANTAAIIT